MPVYEYICKGCGHEFEREQRISEDPIKKCPACGAAKARRQISRTSFVLKGSGWYNDLYASGKPAKSGGDEASPAASESKPAAAPEAAAASSEPSAPKTDGGDKGGSPGKGPKKGGKGAKAAA